MRQPPCLVDDLVFALPDQTNAGEVTILFVAIDDICEVNLVVIVVSQIEQTAGRTQ